MGKLPQGPDPSDVVDGDTALDRALLEGGQG
jgi:hypothetical protein